MPFSCLEVAAPQTSASPGLIQGLQMVLVNDPGVNTKLVLLWCVSLCRDPRPKFSVDKNVIF